MTLLIRPENAADRDAIREVNQLTFGGEAEANLVDALRDGGFVTVSLVAETEAKVVGHILFSAVTIRTDIAAFEVLSLAPMAVLPEIQRKGIGSALVHAGIEACRKLPYGSIVVLGHPEFYPRFGFSPDIACRLKCPFGSGEAWMALELVPESLKGVGGTVEYPPPFDMFK
jgi:putative acetyltransferase